jgi:hypothetical protein
MKTYEEHFHDLECGAKEGLLALAKEIASHEKEKPTYTVKEIVDFALAIADKLCTDTSTKGEPGCKPRSK